MKRSIPAHASFILSLLGYSLLIVIAGSETISGIRSASAFSHFIEIVGTVTSVIAMLLGVVGFIQIRRTWPRLRGMLLAWLGVILSPIAIFLLHGLTGATVEARKDTCITHIQVLSTYVEAYAQDHQGAYPGLDDPEWFHVVDAKLLRCPEYGVDNAFPICYGYNSLLVKAHGRGINKSRVLIPSRIAIVCDTEPMPGMKGGVIGNPASLPPGTTIATAANRHNGGIIVGFCDGHAKFYPEGYQDDPQNAVYQSFIRAKELGYMKP